MSETKFFAYIIPNHTPVMFSNIKEMLTEKYGNSIGNNLYTRIKISSSKYKFIETFE